ncbi:unnamed protein product [Caenorhabditis nigoni]
MRLLFFVLLVGCLCIPLNSSVDIPKWVVKRGCGSCDFCILLNGTVSPVYCISGLDDIPHHARCSFASLVPSSVGNLYLSSTMSIAFGLFFINSL